MLAHSGSSVSSNETMSCWSELAALCKAVCPSRGEVSRMISGGREGGREGRGGEGGKGGREEGICVVGRYD